MAVAIDLITLVLLLGMTYALTSEGLWGSALMFFNNLFAALIAFNFYEPLADLIVQNASFMANFADVVSLMLLYLVPLLLLRLTTETLGPAMVRFPTPLYHAGRVLFSLGGAMITLAMIMLAYQVSPVQQKLLGVFDYKYKPFYSNPLFGRFDRDFLGFFQWNSGYTFPRNGAGERDPSGEFTNKPFLFDPTGVWLLKYQAARPYNPVDILEEAPADGGAAPAAAGAAPAGGPPAGK